MGLLARFRRSNRTPPGPSPALVELRQAVDCLVLALDSCESALDAAHDARLSCRGINWTNAPRIGAAQRRAAYGVTWAMFGAAGAVAVVDRIRKANALDLQRDKAEAIAILSRVAAIKARMADIVERAATITA